MHEGLSDQTTKHKNRVLLVEAFSIKSHTCVMPTQSIIKVFEVVCRAARDGVLITRKGRDKEFHFQDWFQARLAESNTSFDPAGRNSYPDFTLVGSPEGFEVKGLAYPGREADFDSNSQVPVGFHNGRDVYYVFGRYPNDPDGDTFPLLDLVMCHGDFLNAQRGYVHENKSVRAFGSYGDILLRDRKMYVAPTPFSLAEGLAHHRSLIVPKNSQKIENLKKVGSLSRTEVAQQMSAYRFDLKTRDLSVEMEANPNASQTHLFDVYQSLSDPQSKVSMR